MIIQNPIQIVQSMQRATQARLAHGKGTLKLKVFHHEVSLPFGCSALVAVYRSNLDGHNDDMCMSDRG
jgi:hypothetical protein